MLSGCVGMSMESLLSKPCPYLSRAFFPGKRWWSKVFLTVSWIHFLLLLPMIAFCPCQTTSLLQPLKTHRAVFATFAILFHAVLFFFKADFRIRYMAPAIPPLVVLVCFRHQELGRCDIKEKPDALKRRGLIVLGSLVLFALSYNGHYIHGLFNHIRPLDYLFRRGGSGCLYHPDFAGSIRWFLMPTKKPS